MCSSDLEWFGEAFGDVSRPVTPGGNVGEAAVITASLTLRRLVLLAEMGPAGFLPGQGIAQHQIRQPKKILKPQGLLKGLIGTGSVVGHADPLAELRSQRLHRRQPPPQLRRTPADAADLDHQQTQLPVQIRGGSPPTATGAPEPARSWQIGRAHV